MFKYYAPHWIIGIICTLIWCWGIQFGIATDAILLAKMTLPGIIAHALGHSSGIGQKQSSTQQVSLQQTTGD